MKEEAGPPDERAGSRLAVLAFAAVFGLTAVLAIISLPLGVYTVLYTTLAQGYGAATLVRTFVWAGPIPVVLPWAVPLGILFVSEIAVYSVLLVYALAHKNVFRSFADGFRSGLSLLLSNDLVVALLAVGFYVFTVVIIDQVVTAGGAPVGGLSDTNDLFYFVTATISPLREEVGFRVGIIGIVAMLLAIGKSWKGMLNALWRPSSAYEGGPTMSGKAVTVMVALAISSIVFGLWHVLSGSGWEIGKLPGATFGGLVIGYVYVKRGFHVAVLTHWGVDYLGTVFAFFGQGAYGISWTAVPGYVLEQVISLDMVAGIGLASFLVVLYLGYSKFARPRSEMPDVGT